MKSDFSEMYKSQGFWWGIHNDTYNELTIENVYGPYCIECQSDLRLPTNAFIIDEKGKSYWNTKDELNSKCESCGKKHLYKKSVYKMKRIVLIQYYASLRIKLPKVLLDEPPTQVKVRDEDDKYFIAAKIGEKDGRRIGVVYIGEKSKGQLKIDYSQIFIDLDSSQIRWDQSNKLPYKQLAKMVVEFSDVIVESKKNNPR